MKFITVLITAFASLAAASPLQERQTAVCTSPYNTPRCCGGDLLNVVGISCSPPSTRSTSVGGFQQTCAATGKTAKCCILDVVGVTVACIDP
ncbi:fungal hydrophobin-domain-containing protein [Tricladium varicosporioides]|nr:fungal hydrophobin-domain-containing protein [Hymenoscyphus varicosporioides]